VVIDAWRLYFWMRDGYLEDVMEVVLSSGEFDEAAFDEAEAVEVDGSNDLI
jgi:hypothetical protein